MEPKEFQYRSTPGQMQEFSEGSIWKDISLYLEESISLLQFELERAENMEDIKGIQGQLKECRIFSQLPATLIMDMEDKLKEEERKDGKD